ncbi:MAG: DUF6160 family protein [Geobacteraceae bacterium]
MKKLSVCKVAVFTVALLYSTSVTAQFKPLTDDVLANVTGQAGIAVSLENMGLNSDKNRGNAAASELLALANAIVNGTIPDSNPFKMDQNLQRDIKTTTLMMKMNEIAVNTNPVTTIVPVVMSGTIGVASNVMGMGVGMGMGIIGMGMMSGIGFDVYRGPQYSGKNSR